MSEWVNEKKELKVKRSKEEILKRVQHDKTRKRAKNSELGTRNCFLAVSVFMKICDNLWLQYSKVFKGG